MSIEKIRFTLPIILLAATLVGCFSEEEEKEEETAVRAPKLTVSVPATMTTTSTTQKTLAGATVDDPEACAEYFDPTVDFMEDGTAMTRFLVGLSRAQTCGIDWIIEAAITHASSFLNMGVQRIPDASADDITHFRFDNTLDTYSLWLYFADPNQNLPDDTSAIQTIYLTWTDTSDTDVSGRFIMANLPYNPDDPGAPNRARVDFTRTAGTATNRMYFGFSDAHEQGLTGFRVDVTQDGTGDNASYEAKGLMAFAKQPMSASLPTSETFSTPSLKMVATADASGQGAAVASFEDIALHLAVENTQDAAYVDGDYTDPGEFMFGSYEFTLQDRTYFDTTGTISWRKKSATQASYVNTSGANTRFGYDINSTIAALEGSGEGGLNLESGYFTNPCSDTNGADCTAFIQALYDAGLFGAVANSSDAEPADSRKDALDSATLLTSTFPTGEDATTTFTIPDPN